MMVGNDGLALGIDIKGNIAREVGSLAQTRMNITAAADAGKNKITITRIEGLISGAAIAPTDIVGLFKPDNMDNLIGAPINLPIGAAVALKIVRCNSYLGTRLSSLNACKS